MRTFNIRIVCKTFGSELWNFISFSYVCALYLYLIFFAWWVFYSCYTQLILSARFFKPSKKKRKKKKFRETNKHCTDNYRILSSKMAASWRNSCTWISVKLLNWLGNECYIYDWNIFLLYMKKRRKKNNTTNYGSERQR